MPRAGACHKTMRPVTARARRALDSTTKCALHSTREESLYNLSQRDSETGAVEQDKAQDKEQDKAEKPNALDALEAIRRSDVLGECIQSVQTRFREGDYYVWLYRDQFGAPTSWERYSVSNTDPKHDSMTIEVLSLS